MNTEKHKLQNAIWKNQKNYSRSINNIFSRSERDEDVLIMDILSALLIFPVLSLHEIRIYTKLAMRRIDIIFKLEKWKCIKIYEKGDPEFINKLMLLSNLHEKSQIIKCIEYIKSVQNGGFIDIDKIREIGKMYNPKIKETPNRMNHKVIIIEITEKGKVFLGRFIKLYTTFFNNSITRKDLGIIDNIELIKRELKLPIMKSNMGLFAKSVEELKELVKETGIDTVILQSNKNERDAKQGFA